jgi:hypothetical protein
MSTRELPTPTGPLGVHEHAPSGLSLLLAQAERDGRIHGRRLGWLEGLKTGLLFGILLGLAFALVVACGARS